MQKKTPGQSLPGRAPPAIADQITIAFSKGKMVTFQCYISVLSMAIRQNAEKASLFPMSSSCGYPTKVGNWLIWLTYHIHCDNLITMNRLPDTGTFGTREVGILSDIIQTAYTDTLCTETWTQILDMVGQVVPYDAASAVFANVQTGRLENRIIRKMDASLVQWYDAHYPAISVIAGAAQTRRLTVWRPTDVIGKQEYEASEMRQDLLRDFGLGEPVCLTCGSPPQITARFWFLREVGKVDYTGRDRHVLELVQRHICSALVIARNLLQGHIYKDSFQGALLPAFICDSAGKVMDSNLQAKRLLSAGGGERDDRLVEIEGMAQSMLFNQADCMLAELIGKKCQVHLWTVAIPNVPITYTLAITLPEQLRRALCSFMGESGLSDREVEICTMVAQGLRNLDIADKLFIAESTVKDHVSSIFEKLGIESRAGIAPKLLGF